jgi:membrane protein
VKIFKRPLADIIWDTKYDGLSGLRSWGIRLIRFLHALYVEFSESQINLRAMSMVYMTMLSLVPLLAVSFSVLKSFGVHYRMKPFLLNFFSPLGPKGEEVVNRIMEFVSNVQVGVLGGVGLALFMYIAIDIISRVEDAFNTIWKTASSRTLTRRFSDYLTVLIIGPTLVSGAMAVNSSLMNTKLIQYLVEREPFGQLYFIGASLSPYLLVCGAFTFLYKFLPNTRVRFGAAVAGGLVGGILWQTMGWTFTSFIVGSVRYKTIYAGFAVLIFFMLWVYFNWLLILTGVAVSFLWQHPPTAAAVLGRKFPQLQLNERVALGVMFLIGKTFYRLGGSTALRDINAQLNAPPGLIHQLLTMLKQEGLVVQTGDKIEEYFPGRALETIALTDIISTARGTRSKEKEMSEGIGIPELDRIAQTIDGAIYNALGEETLYGLVSTGETPKGEGDESREKEA